MTELNLDTHSARLSRRALLRASGGAISAGAIAQVARAEEDDMLKVPRILGRNGVREYMYVPGSWYDHLEHVRSALKSLNGGLAGSAGFKSSAIIRHPETYGGKKGFQIRLEIDREKFDGEIPRQVGGIPTKIIEPRERRPACCGSHCDWNKCDFDPTPGGVRVFSDGGGGGTMCCWVERNGNYRVLTAAHIEDGASCDSMEFNQGDGWDQWSQNLGGLQHWDINTDYALIDKSAGNHTPTDKIRIESETLTVYGVYSSTAVANNVQDDETCGDDEDNIYQMGVHSGRTQGCITAMNSTNDDNHVCWDYNGYGVEFGPQNIISGDSGGPVFEDGGSYAYIVCLTSAHLSEYGTDCGNRDVGSYGEGTAAYHLRNNEGLTFDLTGRGLNAPNCTGGGCC